MPHCSVYLSEEVTWIAGLCVYCSHLLTTEPTELLFAMQDNIGRTCPGPLQRMICSSIAAFSQITLTTCLFLLSFDYILIVLH